MEICHSERSEESAILRQAVAQEAILRPRPWRGGRRMTTIGGQERIIRKY